MDIAGTGNPGMESVPHSDTRPPLPSASTSRTLARTHRLIQALADIKNRFRLRFALITTQPRPPLLGAAGAAAVALLSRYSNPSRRHTTPRKTCDIMINGCAGPSLVVGFFAAPDSPSAHVSHALGWKPSISSALFRFFAAAEELQAQLLRWTSIGWSNEL
ncbi:hypothetical protein V8C42DRAFT_323197 [Trichoderma barbatum]